VKMAPRRTVHVLQLESKSNSNSDANREKESGNKSGISGTITIFRAGATKETSTINQFSKPKSLRSFDVGGCVPLRTIWGRWDGKSMSFAT